jgi:hypothetical protein
VLFLLLFECDFSILNVVLGVSFALVSVSLLFLSVSLHSQVVRHISVVFTERLGVMFFCSCFCLFVFWVGERNGERERVCVCVCV